jgi:hypothetical protein
MPDLPIFPKNVANPTNLLKPRRFASIRERTTFRELT